MRSNYVFMTFLAFIKSSLWVRTPCTYPPWSFPPNHLEAKEDSNQVTLVSFMTRPFRDNRNALMMSQLWNWLLLQLLRKVICKLFKFLKHYLLYENWKIFEKCCHFNYILSKLFSNNQHTQSPRCPFLRSRYDFPYPSLASSVIQNT